jgi:hypothetical protein
VPPLDSAGEVNGHLLRFWCTSVIDPETIELDVRNVEDVEDE